MSKLLPKYALASTFEDERFDPVTLDELRHLKVELSLLCNFKQIDKPLNWEVGKHGIEINFEH